MSIQTSISAEDIWYNEISVEMICAGMNAYRAWQDRPEQSRTTANLVAMIYSSVEAFRRREQLEKQ